MWSSSRLVAAPGLLLDAVTVRLGEYEAQAELVNASETTAAPVISASRMTLFMHVPFLGVLVMRRWIAAGVNSSLERRVNKFSWISASRGSERTAWPGRPPAASSWESP